MGLQRRTVWWHVRLELFGRDMGDRRVARGGFWNMGPKYLRSAMRGGNATDDRSYGVGFRVGRTLTP
jgi:formylglycine-generating enzyme required for sulfatase activity